MIRRLLASLALAALLVAPSHAQSRAKLMLVQMPGEHLSVNDKRLYWLALQGACREFDIDYTLVPWQSTKGLWMKQGLVYASDGTPIAHDGIVLVGYGVFDWSVVDSFTLARTTLDKWPDVDTWFMGTGGASGYQDGTACSTGIRSVAPPGGSNQYGLYAVGRPYSGYWQRTVNTQVAAAARTGGAYTGVWRGLIGVGAMKGALGAAWTDCSASATNDCYEFTSPSADPDTVQDWYRSRADASGNPIRSRLLFSEMSNGGFTPGADASRVGYMLAKMDSLIRARTGKRLINRVVKEAFVSPRWFAVGHAAIDSDTLMPGINCVPGGSCDSTDVKTTLDRFDGLTDVFGAPVPLTFVVEADSLAHPAYQYQAAMIRRVRHHYVTPTSLAGTYAVSGSHSAGAAGRYLDLFGTRRDRAIGGSAGFGGGCGSPVDSSFECKFTRADSLANAYFPGRVDRVAVAALWDYSPRSVDRTNARQLDTLNAVLHRLGYRGYVAHTMPYDADVGRGKPGPSGGVVPAPRPRGYATFEAEWQVHENISGALVGYMRVVPTRGCEGCATTINFVAAHDNFSEHSRGLFTREWYFNSLLLNYYNHQFQSRTRLILLPAHALGTLGAGTDRFAYWQMARNAVHRSAMINDAAGRRVMTFVTGKELAEEPLW